MATLVHFDIGAVNTARAQRFYEQLFNWKFTKLPMGYHLIETSDLEGKPGVGGGLIKREQQDRTGITPFVGVSSIDATLVKVTELGGKAQSAKLAVPGFGYMALCTDTEQNTFGLFQEEATASSMLL